MAPAKSGFVARSDEQEDYLTTTGVLDLPYIQHRSARIADTRNDVTEIWVSDEGRMLDLFPVCFIMRPSSLGCTFRHALRAAYRTAISAAQILVNKQSVRFQIECNLLHAYNAHNQFSVSLGLFLSYYFGALTLLVRRQEGHQTFKQLAQTIPKVLLLGIPSWWSDLRKNRLIKQKPTFSSVHA